VTTPVPDGCTTRMAHMRRVGLVGCVKKKRDVPMRASELYVSSLFTGRRKYVARTCDRWFVLSAKHGVLEPEEIVAPYDVSLTTMSAAARRGWSAQVLDDLQRRLGGLGSHTFEIHAGAAYRDFGLLDGLLRTGARVEVPAAGLSQGQQLAFYKRAAS
jgi:hypothetical protein